MSAWLNCQHHTSVNKIMSNNVKLWHLKVLPTPPETESVFINQARQSTQEFFIKSSNRLCVLVAMNLIELDTDLFMLLNTAHIFNAALIIVIAAVMFSQWIQVILKCLMEKTKDKIRSVTMGFCVLFSPVHNTSQPKAAWNFEITIRVGGVFKWVPSKQHRLLSSCHWCLQHVNKALNWK